MNLEAIEQRTLSLLKQAMNPLVPFDTLVEHLRREEELGEFSNAELLDFLRHHELFEVVEPLKLAAQGIPEAVFADAGLRLSPHVILNTRVPTERQMADQMGRQLRSLRTPSAPRWRPRRNRDNPTGPKRSSSCWRAPKNCMRAWPGSPDTTHCSAASSSMRRPQRGMVRVRPSCVLRNLPGASRQRKPASSRPGRGYRVLRLPGAC